MLKELSDEIKKWNKYGKISHIYHIERWKSFKGHSMNLNAENKDGEMIISLYNKYFGNAVTQTYFSKYDSIITQVSFIKDWLPKWYIDKWVDIKILTGCVKSEYLSDNIDVRFYENFHTITIKSVTKGLNFNNHEVNINLITNNRNLNRKIICNFKNSITSEWKLLEKKWSTEIAFDDNTILLPESILKLPESILK